MYEYRTMWQKYQAVKLADKVGDSFASIRSQYLPSWFRFSPETVKRWRRELPKIALPPTYRNHVKDVCYHTDFPELPILEKGNVHINSIPDEVIESFRFFLGGQKLTKGKLQKLYDYAILDGEGIGVTGNVLQASWAKRLDDQCRIIGVESGVIYYENSRGSVEVSAAAKLTESGGVAIFTENSFPRDFLSYLTLTYQEPIGQYLTTPSEIKELEKLVLSGSLPGTKPNRIFFNTNYDLLLKIFGKELFEMRRDALLDSHNLWEGGFSPREVYEILSAVGYDGFRKLLVSCIANPAISNSGWPDLVVVKNGEVEFVEIKVGENLNSNQLHSLKKLNEIFPGKVSVLRAFKKSALNQAGMVSDNECLSDPG